MSEQTYTEQDAIDENFEARCTQWIQRLDDLAAEIEVTANEPAQRYPVSCNRAVAEIRAPRAVLAQLREHVRRILAKRGLRAAKADDE